MHGYLKFAMWIAALTSSFALAAEPVAAPPPSVSATDAAAPVPDTRYHSAFTGYQSFRGQKLAPWREVNDEVHKAGGHIGIFGGAAGVRAQPLAPHPEERKK